MTTIAVVGLGYVGLPLAVEFGKKYATIGFDLSAEKVAAYKKHVDPTGEVSTDELRGRSPLLVISKADLPGRLDGALLERHAGGLPLFPLSALSGEGCARFVEALAARCRDAGLSRGECTSMPAPNRRHQDALRRAGEFLDLAAALISRRDRALDRAAAELRSALAAIGEIAGETVTEEIVERIFSRFCIGK